MHMPRAATRRGSRWPLIAVTASVVVGAGLVAVAPAATAGTADNRPATASAAIVPRPIGGFETFYRAFDGSVYERTVTAGVFSAAVQLGGSILGAPAAAAAGNSLVLAVRGSDSSVWIRTRTNGTWAPSWVSIGGRVTAAPAVTQTADGSIQVFARGASYDLWSRSRTAGGVWSAWSALPDTTAFRAATAPAAVLAGGTTWLFVGDANHRVAYSTSSGEGWSDWSVVPGTMSTYSAPSAAVDQSNQTITIAARATDNRMVVTQHRSSGWSGWLRVGGQLIDAPAVAVAAAGAPSGFMRTVVRGSDDGVWTDYFMNGSWSSFTRAWTPAALPAVPVSLRGGDWTRIQTTSKVVALTFDGGANADGLRSILSTLNNNGARGTFMLTGNFVRDFPAESNQVALSGFAIGNHSNTHPDFTTLSDSQVAAEISTARTAIRNTTGAETRPIFRFPSGARNARVIADVNGLGYVPVRWTVDTLGWEGTSGGQSVQSVIDRVVQAAQPGEIVLMHVGSNPTDHTTLDADALPTVIAKLRGLGYSFVTLRTLTG